MVPRRILPIIVLSQFAGTSLWFAGNAVISDLQKYLDLPVKSIGWVTNAVLFGFIAGTLTFAFFSFADRFSPVKIFLLSAVTAALLNLGTLISNSLFSLLIFRILTGFFLAGIYPVGMKIAASWYKEGLGRALGWLVGALVLGTAFPHLIRALQISTDWRFVMVWVSCITILGGVLLYLLVPDGPMTGIGTQFKFNAIGKAFQSKSFRSAAFGYFGHMWELYAFWAFTPLLVANYPFRDQLPLSVSMLSFLIIAIGGLGCVIGGIVSLKKGSAKIAFFMLSISGMCCIASAFIPVFPPAVFLIFLLIWGFAVVGDSPQFSALTAKTAPPQYVGTGLTIVNSIGFAITMVSISIINSRLDSANFYYLFLLLIPGPLFGLWSIRNLAFPGR